MILILTMLTLVVVIKIRIVVIPPVFDYYLIRKIAVM